MATERQIAANRRNAQKSTGPRSPAAKKRTSRNALRHGLATSFAPNAAEAILMDKLARQIAGSCKASLALECARDVAAAQFDLARVRRLKVELIRHVMALGSIDPPPVFSSRRDERRYITASLRANRWLPLPISPDALESLPSGAAERVAEAMRRALPELLKLERYEARAISRRDRAIRAFAQTEALSDTMVEI